MLADDPEAPTTINKRFNYPPLTGGRVTARSSSTPARSRPSTRARRRAGRAPGAVSAAAAAPPPAAPASNFLVVSPDRSATGNTLATMGPQLGYYYPEIVQQMDLHGPGINAQGAAVPGLAMYILIGRTKNYAWSLTSAGQDVRDVYAERLCEPGGGTPDDRLAPLPLPRQVHPLQDFDAGNLAGKELTYPTSVHGNFIGTATVERPAVRAHAQALDVRA